VVTLTGPVLTQSNCSDDFDYSLPLAGGRFYV
jgi:hypothetical protein